jgi:hypothetical protein
MTPCLFPFTSISIAVGEPVPTAAAFIPLVVGATRARISVGAPA